MLAVTPKLNRMPDSGSHCTLTSTAEFDDEWSTHKDGYDRTCKSTVAVFSFDFQPKFAFAFAKTTSATTPIGMLTRDPIGFEGSKWLRYRYADGNPLIKFDPGGEVTIGCNCKCDLFSAEGSLIDISRIQVTTDCGNELASTCCTRACAAQRQERACGRTFDCSFSGSWGSPDDTLPNGGPPYPCSRNLCRLECGLTAALCVRYAPHPTARLACMAGGAVCAFACGSLCSED